MDPGRLPDLLSDADRDRLPSMSPPRRTAFVAGRTLLQTALSQSCCLGSDVPAIERLPSGKLAPVRVGDQTIHMSLSHTDGYVAVLLSEDPLSGVDIEPLGRTIDWWPISQRRFSDQEAAWLRDVRAQHGDTAAKELFLRLWTLKEAWVKAEDSMLVRGLRTFVIEQRNSVFVSAASRAQLVSKCEERSGLMIGLLLPPGSTDCALYTVSDLSHIDATSDLRSDAIMV